MSILDEILDYKRWEIKEAISEVPLKKIKEEAVRAAFKPRGFTKAVFNAPQDCAVIAEIKRRSPSKGVLREDLDPAELARAYAKNGAAAISVLTDRKFFGGSPEDLILAREAVKIPVLRKDFIIDEYQLYETITIGADAILLIAAALDCHLMKRLYEKAVDLGLDVLVEVHEREELAAALDLPEAMLGINNRNLKTFQTDISVTTRLLRHVPDDRIIVSESGIKTADDVNALNDRGVSAVLVGESLVTRPDPGAALKELLA